MEGFEISSNSTVIENIDRDIELSDVTSTPSNRFSYGDTNGPPHLVMHHVCFTTFDKRLDDYPIRLDELVDRKFTIGRGPTNCLVLGGVRTKREVVNSRFHAVIKTNEDGVLCIMDLRSRNGTFVNEVQIEPNVMVPIKRNDYISFSSAALQPAGTINPYNFKLVYANDLVQPKYDNEFKLCETQTSDIMRELECSICKDCLLNPYVLSCSHACCGDCLAKWFVQQEHKSLSKSCPMCRTPFTDSSGFFRCKVLESLIEKTVAHAFTSEELMQRQYRKETWENQKLLKRKRSP